MKTILDYLHLYMGCEADTNITHYNGKNSITKITPVDYSVIMGVLQDKEKAQSHGHTNMDHLYCKLILRDFKSLTKEELLEFGVITMTPEQLNGVTDEIIQDTLDRIRDEGIEALDFDGCEPDTVFKSVLFLVSKKIDIFNLKEQGFASYLPVNTIL